MEAWQLNSPIDFDWYIIVSKLVEQSGVPNHAGCRIEIPTHLNIPEWERLLVHYEGKWIIDRLKYGWPIGYEGDINDHIDRIVENHKGALEHEKAIDDYLQGEIKEGHVMGPFLDSPFDQPVKISPLSSTPKKNTSERRIIMDLSFPAGDSVNDGIPKGSYMGESTDINYGSVDQLAKIIHEKGQGCLLFKIDLHKCYRQWSICPGDIRKLGYRWRGKIFRIDEADKFRPGIGLRWR